MWSFLLGLLLGVAGKAVYDLFKEELPTGASLNTSRIEALLDETRQNVRELREEVRQAAESARTSVQEKAARARAGGSERAASSGRNPEAGQTAGGSGGAPGAEPTGPARPA